MAVSDDSNSEPNQAKRGGVPKQWIRLTDAQWGTARYQYESDALHSLLAVANAYNISQSTVEKRAAKESWQKGSKVANGAIIKLQEATEAALTKTADKLAERLGKKWEQDMAPWFEREKRAHVQDQIKRAKKRQKLLDSLISKNDKITAKDMANYAKGDDTYDNIKRRNLGMSDGNALAGALTLNVLANQAAISVSH